MAEKRKGFDLAAALGSVSSLDTGNRPQLEYIDIDLIDPDPKNRKVDGIKELAQNIALIGLQQPLAIRPNPEAEGRYIAVSGHRRRLALKQLVDEGEERFRPVPCLVAPPGMSDAMIRLMLLSGNMVTQGLTPAEMAEATKELEDAIYKLKEEGHEFPGKVRTYVANICGIAGSRVTRLKNIRKKLAEPWVSHWESGELAESSAYLLAQCSRELQEQAYHVLAADGDISPRGIPSWKYDHLKEVEQLSKCTCSQAGGLPCERITARKEATIDSGIYSRCAQCCATCYYLATCEMACSRCADLAAQEAQKVAERKAEEKKEKAAEQERAAQFQEAGRKAWMRIGKALRAANVPLDDIVEDFICHPDDDDREELRHRFAGESFDDGAITDDHPLEFMQMDELLHLADTLGVSLDYLFLRTDDPREIREIKRGVQEWRSRGETPPEGEIIITYGLTNDGPKYTPAVWDGRRFHAPGKPDKELTGLGQQFTKWTLLPEDE